MPVCLGIINLAAPKGYFLPGGVRVLYILFMLWGGELANRSDIPDLTAEADRFLRAIVSAGVSHNNERKFNIL